MEPTAATKVCIDCRVEQPIDQFYRKSKTSEARRSYCKACNTIRQREWCRANAASLSAYRRKRYVEIPEVRERSKQVSQAWVAANPERVRAAKRRWNAAHADYFKQYYADPVKRRHRYIQRRAYQLLVAAKPRVADETQIRGEITNRDLDRLLLHYRRACAYCATPFGERVEWDHVIPLSRGGHHAIGNIVPCCRCCNQSKHTKFVTEWRHHAA